MRVIELDAGEWKGPPDFYGDLLAAIGAPDLHGHNVNALIDSMAYGGMNAVEGPYRLRIKRMKNLDEDTRQEIAWLAQGLAGSKIELILETE